MDKDGVVGSAKEVKGKIKESVGKAVGDAKLKSEGKADKIEGKVQNASTSADSDSPATSSMVGAERHSIARSESPNLHP